MTHNFKICGWDTDSILINKPDHESFSKEERLTLLNELNSLFPEKIKFADDGYFKCAVILKAKNYILLKENGEISKKGSGLKSSKLEKSLSVLIDEIILSLLYNNGNDLVSIYHKYIKLVNNLTDIKGWTAKHTFTQKVKNPSRTNEQKQLDALNGKSLQLGDKMYLYFRKDDTLGLEEHWCGDHNPSRLMNRIYSTFKIFKNVINMNDFSKYHLKNKKIKAKLQEVLND